MRRAIGKHLRDFLAILAMIALAGGIALYILSNQGLRFPWQEDPLEISASFTTAQAVTPGQGQTVRVAGVEVGDVDDVELQDGKAIIKLSIDAEYDGMVRRDATALLRPRTALKDMFIELNPGSPEAPEAKEDFRLPISNTLPDVNADEFLSALDTDTRQYIKLLLQGAGEGLKGRGNDLRAVLKRFEPTHRDLALVSSETAKRTTELRRLIRSLNLVTRELGSKDDDLAQLVDSASKSFGTLANRREEVSGTVRRLPGTLAQATRALNRVEGMARVLRPAAQELRAVPPAIIESNREVRPFALEAAPLLRSDIRPFARAAAPAVGELAKSGPDLGASEQGLLRTFKVLNTLGNLAGNNPRGRESQDTPGRDEGFLFHSAWGTHQIGSFLSWADSQGSARKIVNGASCRDWKIVTKTYAPAGLGLAVNQLFNGSALSRGAPPFDRPDLCPGTLLGP